MNKKINIAYCKKTINENKYGEFVNGKIYTNFILEGELNYPPKIKTNYRYKYIYVFSNNGRGGRRFHLDRNLKDHYIPNFYDYFYDENEYRKMKLEKLK